MPRLAKGPDGVVQSFPDDATDAEIGAALGAAKNSTGKAIPKSRTWTDVAVDALPTALATAGGIIGGAGGTAFGMGIGGVPGAAGGAGLGGAAGEAAKQLINRARGAEAPATSGEAAKAIGQEGVIDAAMTGAMGKALPHVATALEEFGTSPTAAKTGAKVGRFLGATVPTVAGAVEAGPMGAIAGLVGASKTAWAGGKTGWFTTKLMQDAARPIATLLSKATGKTVESASATLSGVSIGEAVKMLRDAGLSQGEALRTVLGSQAKAITEKE